MSVVYATSGGRATVAGDGTFEGETRTAECFNAVKRNSKRGARNQVKSILALPGEFVTVVQTRHVLYFKAERTILNFCVADLLSFRDWH